MFSFRILLTALTLLGTTCMPAHAFDFANEYLQYRVTYKWGLINKNAGTASLRLERNNNGTYNALLAARSDSWADHIYSVRDTLSSVMSDIDMRPLKYVKRAHEDGKFSHDEITYTYFGSNVHADCTRYRESKDGKITETTKQLDASVPAVDMLSIYYYMRQLNYDAMHNGQKTTATIFSGKRKETLTLTYNGIDTVNLDNTKYNCFKITFTFTSEGGKQSSSPMTAWIRTDATRIPIKIVGQLPVGKIQVLFVKASR